MTDPRRSLIAVLTNLADSIVEDIYIYNVLEIAPGNICSNTSKQRLFLLVINASYQLRMYMFILT